MTSPRDGSDHDRVTLRSLVQAVADTPVSEMPQLREALFRKQAPPRWDLGEAARIGFALASVVFAVMASWLLFFNQPHAPRGRPVPAVATAPAPVPAVDRGDAPAQFMPLVDLRTHAGPFRIAEARMSRVQMAATGVPVDLANADPFVRVQIVYDGAARPVAVRPLPSTR